MPVSIKDKPMNNRLLKVCRGFKGFHWIAPAIMDSHSGAGTKRGCEFIDEAFFEVVFFRPAERIGKPSPPTLQDRLPDDQ